MAIVYDEITYQGAALSAVSTTDLLSFENSLTGQTLKGHRVKIGAIRAADVVFALYINGATDAANDITITAGNLSGSVTHDVTLSQYDVVGLRIKTLASGVVAAPVFWGVKRDDPTSGGDVADGSITTAKLAASSVTTAKIADANVTTAKIADANITTAKIADGNVTSAKLGSNLDAAKIGDGSVSNAEFQYLNNLTGNIQAQIDAIDTGGSFTIATQAEAEAGTENTKGMTPLRTKQAIDALAPAGGGSAFGLDVKDYNASGSAATTTGAISSASNSLTVASASTFAIGHGILVVGAGTSGADLVTYVTDKVGSVLTLFAAAATGVAGAVVQHDDTRAIQAALNAIGTNTGYLFFPLGVYRVNGYPNTTTESILYFTYLAPGSSTGVYTVRLEGEAASTTSANPNSSTGVIIDYSRAAARTYTGMTLPALWAAKKWEENYGNGNTKFSYVVPDFKNFTFRTCLQPKMADLQFNNAVGLRLENVFLDLNVNITSAAIATSSYAQGIVAPGANNHAWITIKNVNVVGRRDAYVVAEHTEFEGTCAAYLCDTLLKVNWASHAIKGSLSPENCPHLIYATGTSVLDLQLNIERPSGTPATNEIECASGSDLRGWVRYQMSQVGGDGTSNYTVTSINCANLNLIRLYDKLTLTPADDWDGTLPTYTDLSRAVLTSAAIFKNTTSSELQYFDGTTFFKISTTTATPPVATDYFKANFTAADGTALASYSPEVGSMSAPVGTWTIQGNKLKETGATVFEAVALSSSFGSGGNFKLTMVYNTGGANANKSTGVFFRYVDANNYLWLIFQYPESLVKILSVVSGSVTAVASESFSAADNADLAIEITCNGTSVLVKINSTTKFGGAQTITANQTGDKMGIYRGFPGETATFDTIDVVPI